MSQDTPRHELELELEALRRERDALAERVRDLEEENAKLKLDAEHYQVVIDNAPLGVVSFERSGKIFFANPTMLAILGSPSLEATLAINMLTHPALVKSGIAQRGRDCIEQEIQVLDEIPYTSVWGRELLLRFHVTPIETEGSVTGAVAIVEDYTLISHAERALRESEQRLINVIENMPVLLMAFSAEGRLMVWNKACERLTGYSRDEMLGRRDVMSVLYPNVEYRQGLACPWKEGVDSFSAEQQVSHKDGGAQVVAWTNVSGRFPIPGWSSWVIGVDMTDHRLAQRERDALIVELKEALTHVKTLRGLIPICATCKKIRDDTGYWNQLEVYLAERSEADFSHSICPECAADFEREILAKHGKKK